VSIFFKFLFGLYNVLSHFLFSVAGTLVLDLRLLPVGLLLTDGLMAVLTLLRRVECLWILHTQTLHEHHLLLLELLLLVMPLLLLSLLLS
jgi:hypothetical protein